MKKKKPHPNEDKKFLMGGVKLFHKDKSILQIQLQNDYGTVVIARKTPEKSSIHAIGFNADWNDGDEDEDADATEYLRSRQAQKHKPNRR